MFFQCKSRDLFYTSGVCLYYNCLYYYCYRHLAQAWMAVHPIVFHQSIFPQLQAFSCVFKRGTLDLLLLRIDSSFYGKHMEITHYVLIYQNYGFSKSPNFNKFCCPFSVARLFLLLTISAFKADNQIMWTCRCHGKHHPFVKLLNWCKNDKNEIDKNS